MTKRLVIACGGTGGHFYPTLSIAKEFMSRGGEVTLMIAGNHAAEQLELARQEGIPAVEVPTVRLPRTPLQLLQFPFSFLRCIKAARRAMKPLNPDIVLGMGSFASVPQCLATPKGIPMFLHEGNSFMGKANRWLTKLRKIAGVTLSLPLDDERQLHGAPSAFVGMPLRRAIIEAAENSALPSEYLPSLKLRNGVFTILVFGGSQGARAINEIFGKTAPLMKDWTNKFQLIHLTGTDDNAALQEAYAQAGIQAAVFKGTPHIHLCYLAANAVFCRSGASSICELALFRKPLFLIPLPSAADNHQYHNANMLNKAKAAKFIEQKYLTPDKLAEALQDAIGNPQSWEAMGQNLAAFAKPTAAKDAVDFFSAMLLGR